jgi:hypothetical protein
MISGSNWLPHELPFGVAQRPGLMQDFIGDGELADVVELGCPQHLVQLVGVVRELAGKIGDELRDAVDVVVWPWRRMPRTSSVFLRRTES